MKKIFATITVCGLALVTFASGATAFAADETGTATTPAINHGPGTADDNISAVVDPGAGFVSDDTDPANAESTAEFIVEDGFLTLDAVPDLNFGTTKREVLHADKTLNLVDGEVTKKDTHDGNSQLKLAVSDYRSEKAGWTVQAKVSSFTSNKNEIDGKLNLVLNSDDTENPATFTKELVSGAGVAPVVTHDAADKEDDGTHTYTVSKDTTLTFAKGTTLEKGTYDAVLTWQLNNSVVSTPAQ